MYWISKSRIPNIALIEGSDILLKLYDKNPTLLTGESKSVQQLSNFEWVQVLAIDRKNIFFDFNAKLINSNFFGTKNFGDIYFFANVS